MGLVLISFVGKGQLPRDGQSSNLSRSKYLQATYRFAAENDCAEATFQSSFFGMALLQRLRQMNRPVKRWLLMGTRQSLWNDLIDLAPSATSEDLLGVWNTIDDAVKEATADGSSESLNQALLDQWQSLLTNEAQGTDVLCKLVGAADSPESQERISQALFEAVENDDEIVLDITHGFRHQPVIASYLIMLLRWLRGVKRVEFYYGAFELKSSDACPVLKLDVCRDLLQATEAVATYRTTGNYLGIGDTLKLNEPFPANLKQLYHSDEVNRPNRKTPELLATELQKVAPDFDSVKAAIAPLLMHSLEWSAKPSFAERLGHKARFAFEHQQYFKATPLLWEAILIAGCNKFHISCADTHGGRAASEDELYKKLQPVEQETLRSFEQLRNAVVHGTHPKGKEANEAWHNSDSFKRLFLKARALFESLL